MRCGPELTSTASRRCGDRWCWMVAAHKLLAEPRNATRLVGVRCGALHCWRTSQRKRGAGDGCTPISVPDWGDGGAVLAALPSASTMVGGEAVTKSVRSSSRVLFKYPWPSTGARCVPPHTASHPPPPANRRCAHPRMPLMWGPSSSRLIFSGRATRLAAHLRPPTAAYTRPPANRRCTHPRVLLLWGLSSTVYFLWPQLGRKAMRDGVGDVGDELVEVLGARALFQACHAVLDWGRE